MRHGAARGSRRLHTHRTKMLYLRKDLSTQPQNWAVHKRGEWRRVVRFHHLSSVARRPRAPEPRPRRARAAHNAAQGSWRVKLYQLNDDGQWDDHGTGHAVVQDVQARPTRPRPTPLSLAARARGVGARPSPRSRDGARARAGESGARHHPGRGALSERSRRAPGARRADAPRDSGR